MRFSPSTLALLLGVWLLNACEPSSETTAPIADRTPVDEAIDDVVERGVMPLLYARVERFDGSVVYEHSAVNPLFTEREPTGESWMRIWSMSKSVTIATILSLEEDGILSRTDPVTDYIPEFSELAVLSADADQENCGDETRAPKRAMTIEDLLNHNDGFYYPFTGYTCLDEAMVDARLPEATSPDDLISRIASLTLHPTGIGASQYGIGTTVLGLVAERATGKPFADVVEEHVTGPLGIADTLRYTLPADAETYPRVTGKSGSLALADSGDLDIFGGPVPQYTADTNIFLGGEGMVATTKGYAAFLRMMGSMGALDGTRILEEETVIDWSSPKTQLDSPYGHNGFNIWVTNGRFDDLPNQKPGLLVGGGYEGTAFWIDVDAGYVGLLMSQVHAAPLDGVDEVARLRGLIYQHILEPGVQH
ncbi:MAG: serine hydrolase [Pseudomonadota bacterium]